MVRKLWPNSCNPYLGVTTTAQFFGAFSSQALLLPLPCDTCSCRTVSAVVVGYILAASTSLTVRHNITGVFSHSLGRLVPFSFTLIPKKRRICFDSRGPRSSSTIIILLNSAFGWALKGAPMGSRVRRVGPWTPGISRAHTRDVVGPHLRSHVGSHDNTGANYHGNSSGKPRRSLCISRIY